ncbi:uncharacterized protein UV8b_07764 [Ustilaginoidea virens]|uniref:Alcohol acetyltransferase n=1 Tax=Ustilaginoidea virens TaxID=1159556 RepID=A0A8E5MKC8_USTVR|nr:uncharacterized protein UV8b_07764 [Ustilaginoidea virens]QUC23523.1 hypothetical protein UV8b_07764 [Ustilaginoidea virens]
MSEPSQDPTKTTASRDSQPRPQSEPARGVGAEPQCAYTIQCASSVYERMFYALYRLGVQSNIAVSARYSSQRRQLSREAVLCALHAVVQAHPSLRAVFVRRPSTRKGHHDLFKATLNVIRIDDAVEFEYDDGEGVTSALLERIHNEWAWMPDEPDKPWWKLVVKGRDLVWVCHHAVADGMSGFVFHREFLAALNGMAWPRPLMAEAACAARTVKTDASVPNLPLDPLTVSTVRYSILELIGDLVMYTLLALLLGKWTIYSSLPPSRSCLRDTSKPANAENYTKTCISSRRIPAASMAEVLAACRANGTTFTPLLLVAFTMALAGDHFPNAKLGRSRYSYDLRPLMDTHQLGGSTPSGSILNLSAGAQHIHWLRRFRAADAALSAEDAARRQSAWDLVREYKAGMERRMHGKGTRLWKSVSLLGTSVEDFVKLSFDPLGRTLPPTYHVSNLGAFPSAPRVADDKKSAAWAVQDAQFSVAATNGTVGTHGIILSVAGVRGGDTVIHAAYEAGVVERGMAEQVLQGIVRRIEALVASSR